VIVQHIAPSTKVQKNPIHSLHNAREKLPASFWKRLVMVCCSRYYSYLNISIGCSTDVASSSCAVGELHHFISPLQHPAPLSLSPHHSDNERRGREPVRHLQRACVRKAADNMDSWRRPGQGNRQTQDRSSSANNPTKDGGRQQATPTAPGNAWGGKGKAAGSAPAAQSNAPAQHHVPVRDFNSNEVKEFLRKSTSNT
jgi:hypothetical protein